jgi:hypothetical protein
MVGGCAVNSYMFPCSLANALGGFSNNLSRLIRRDPALLPPLIHYLGLVIGIAGILTWIGLTAAAREYLDPDRSPDDRLTTAFFPASSKKSDFLEPGWQLWKRAWLAFAIAVLGAILWGSTSRSL